MKFIKIKAANGSDVIIFIDKITHLYTQGFGRCMIKLTNEEGILVLESTETVLRLIQHAHGN
jgi:hypothetical protein